MMNNSSPKTTCLLISGPTAVGKTALSLSLAEALGGEIVNIDSVQLYREADIGSAKASLEERARVPHHLVDILSPNEPNDIAKFRERVHDTVGEIASRGHLPILVGGSGMYITALFQGLSSLPKGSAALRAELEGQDTEELWRELNEVDPATAARLHPADKLRIVRALEVIRLTGSAMSEQYEQREEPKIQAVMLVLVRPRAELYDGINARAKKMVEGGIVEETRRIVSAYGKEPPLLKSLGYAQSLLTLGSTLEPKALSEEIALHTRRYAKRQLTFWRNEPQKRGWRVRPGEEEEASELEDAGFRAFSWTKEKIVTEVSGRIVSLSSNEVWFLQAGVGV